MSTEKKQPTHSLFKRTYNRILSYLYKNGESIGIPLMVASIFAVLVTAIVSIKYESAVDGIAIALGFLSVSLALIAIGFSAFADAKSTTALEGIRDILLYSPGQDTITEPLKEAKGTPATPKTLKMKDGKPVKEDKGTPATHHHIIKHDQKPPEVIGKRMPEDKYVRMPEIKYKRGPEVPVKSKEAAQQRVNDDAKRVGFVRGEVYQLPDGTWGVRWGGKYPL